MLLFSSLLYIIISLLLFFSTGLHNPAFILARFRNLFLFFGFFVLFRECGLFCYTLRKLLDYIVLTPVSLHNIFIVYRYDAIQ